MLIYGLPNAILFGYWAYTMYLTVVTQFLVFFIVCQYLALKIKTLNKAIERWDGQTSTATVRRVLYLFTTVYKELKQYNSTYMSKYLLIIWFFNGAGIVLLTYMALFNDITLVMRIAVIYGAITQALFYLFVIFTASSVTHETKKTYKILNSFYIRFSKQQSLANTQNFRAAFKVNIF